MAETKKNIIDSIFELLTKFSRTDEQAIDEDWMSYKIDQVRSELIVKQYNQTKVIDSSWLSDMGLLTCYKVNSADDKSITCDCYISKTTIPQTISLQSQDGNLDLGLFSVTSACGKFGITSRPMYRWGSNTPSENVSSLFDYYFRIGTSMYISNPNIQKIRVIALLLSPEEGYLKNSAPIASGSLVNGTVYYVAYSGIVYNSIFKAPGSTFIATATTTFGGAGTVYLNVQAAAWRDTDNYPASGEMIRQIELEILTKEFGIEKQAIVDIRNDSVDDALKVNA